MIIANNKGKGKCIYIDSVTCNYTNACLTQTFAVPSTLKSLLLLWKLHSWF